MGNKSKKPAKHLEGQKWKKGVGRDVTRMRLGGSWSGLQPANVSSDGHDIDEKTKRKVARPPLKVR